jgi:hypothetical protein
MSHRRFESKWTAFKLTRMRAVLQYTFFSLALQPFGSWPFFQFLNSIHSRQYSLDGGSARRKPATYTQQHKHRINAQRHPFLEWVWAGEDDWCLRPRGHCDQLILQCTRWVPKTFKSRCVRNCACFSVHFPLDSVTCSFLIDYLWLDSRSEWFWYYLLWYSFNCPVAACLSVLLPLCIMSHRYCKAFTKFA